MTLLAAVQNWSPPQPCFEPWVPLSEFIPNAWLKPSEPTGATWAITGSSHGPTWASREARNRKVVMSAAVIRAAPQCPTRSVALMVDRMPYRAAMVGMAAELK